MPWVVGGNFNVILNEDEKLVGLPFTTTKAIDFASCISSCALQELKFTSSNYTWWNGRIERDCIFKRLDKVLINQEFLDIFPALEIHHLLGKAQVMLHYMKNVVPN